MNEKLYIPIAIIVAGVIMGGALYISNRSIPRQFIATSGSSNTIMQANSIRPVTSNDHILGNPNANIVMVEYSDTECPFCKDFYVSLQKIMVTYGKDGTVAWVYRHFPIPELHKKAFKEAEAVECAGDQGGPDMFWKYLTLVYSKTESNDTLDPKQLPKFAKDLNLNVTDFNTCLSSGKFTAKIQADYDDAVESGGQGTPHTILITKDGGKLPIEGAPTYENLKNTIDLLLGKTVQ